MSETPETDATKAPEPTPEPAPKVEEAKPEPAPKAEEAKPEPEAAKPAAAKPEPAPKAEEAKPEPAPKAEEAKPEPAPVAEAAKAEPVPASAPLPHPGAPEGREDRRAEAVAAEPEPVPAKAEPEPEAVVVIEAEAPPRPAPPPAIGDEPIMTIRAMLEAGVHFGHQTTRWNPKMRQYIFGSRNGIHIVDLQQTLPLFLKAYNYVLRTVANGGSVLFVGTKKQAQDVIREEASRCGMYYVTNRWLGGTLTNWKTVRGSIDRLRRIEQMAEDGTFEKLTKKEVLSLERQRMKLERNLGGIKDLDGLPGVVFIIDPRKERIAVAESRKLNLPIVAVTDTNCDPDVVDFAIPGNDDAIRAIRLFASKVADAAILGKRLGQEQAAAAARDRAVNQSDAVPEPIRVHSGGDGPKVEVVSRRSAPRPAPEAAATPERDE